MTRQSKTVVTLFSGGGGSTLGYWRHDRGIEAAKEAQANWRARVVARIERTETE